MPSADGLIGARLDRAGLARAARVIEVDRTVGFRLRRCIQLEIWTMLVLEARRR